MYYSMMGPTRLVLEGSKGIVEDRKDVENYYGMFRWGGGDICIIMGGF